MYAQHDTPAAVPKREAKMYWLVFLAVMSGKQNNSTQAAPATFSLQGWFHPFVLWQFASDKELQTKKTC
jgi:hypothetical protein